MGATLTASANHKAQAPTPTFYEHIQELRNRLFWVAAVFLLASAAAYPFKDAVIQALVLPLGDQELFYLTPIGGFSFIIKICTYVGLLAAIPMLMYHMYRYLEPIMGEFRRSVVFYTFFSVVLALVGVFFAYFISLPSALHFLTGFGEEHITAMLTVDAYMSFVITYLLGAAILFQVPIILLIINTITPLPPSKLMKYQRYVVLGAFVIAAVISPTPDVMNQALLAVPIIAMYNFGVLLVWFTNRMRARRKKPAKNVARHTPVRRTEDSVSGIPEEVVNQLIAAKKTPALVPIASKAATEPKPKAAPRQSQPSRRHMDFVIRPMPIARDSIKQTQPISRPMPQIKRPRPEVTSSERPVRSIDGLLSQRSMSI